MLFFILYGWILVWISVVRDMIHMIVGLEVFKRHE